MEESEELKGEECVGVSRLFIFEWVWE